MKTAVRSVAAAAFHRVLTERNFVPCSMTYRTYGQLRPLARSFDLMGDRWTLLLIREFLLGPKRFKDLLAILPAMGTNRLSERLAMLVQNGVTQQVNLRTPPATPAYELTELGEQLRKPVIALGFWGLGLPIDERIDPSSVRAALIALYLTGFLRLRRVSGAWPGALMVPGCTRRTRRL